LLACLHVLALLTCRLPCLACLPPLTHVLPCLLAACPALLACRLSCLALTLLWLIASPRLASPELHCVPLLALRSSACTAFLCLLRFALSCLACSARRILLRALSPKSLTSPRLASSLPAMPFLILLKLPCRACNISFAEPVTFLYLPPSDVSFAV
jgi:hypothetical protein